MNRDSVPTTPIDAALDALGRGWTPVPVAARSKRPVLKEWERYRATEESIKTDFDGKGNVGILLGEPSGNLCDVDCDVPEAAVLAASWLPKTGLIHGRPGRPASHFWYIVTPAPRTLRFQDPTAEKSSSCLVELRGAGGQTVIPPSIHVSGEAYEWESYSEPAPVAAEELLAWVKRVAAGSLLSRRWPKPGSRHDATLALAAFLLRRNGNDLEGAVRFIAGVASAARDEECQRRLEDVRDTSRRLFEGRPVTGRRQLDAFFDPKVVAAIGAWLGLSRGTSGPAADERRATLPRIVVRGRPFRDVSTDAIAALRLSNDPPTVFARGGGLVAVVEDESGVPQLKPMSEAMLRGRLARAANFVVERTKGEDVVTSDVPPPLDTVRDVAALDPARWGVPPIEALVHIPVLREDGSISSESGYDPSTRLFQAPGRDLEIPAIPDSPSAQDVAAATNLLDEALSGFPFVPGPGDPGDRKLSPSRANAFALLLTPILRTNLQGNVPIALLDAPQPGTGKSLLAEVCAQVALGRSAPMLSPPADEDEWRKRITAALLSGSPLIVFDNLDSVLRSGALASAVTSRTWSDRVLGKSENIVLPQRATWIVTGNNIRLGGDLPRRCYQIRLDAESSRPWRRSGFRHENLVGWVSENRGRLVAALLVLCRAWYAAGQPSSISPVIGGFESWSLTVGGILGLAGVDGFLKNLDDLYERADDTGTQWESFLRALADRFGTGSWGAADVSDQIRSASVLLQALPDELAVTYDTQESKLRGFQSRLGRALKRKVGVRYGGDGIHIRSVPSSGSSGGVARYMIAVGPTSAPPSSAAEAAQETSETSETFPPDLYAREKSVENARVMGRKKSQKSPKSPDACPACGESDVWTSRSGVKTCRRCHPPAPGAEEVSR